MYIVSLVKRVWKVRLVDTVRLKRAGQLVRAEDFDGAESVLKQVIDCEPKDVSALTQFADVAMARGDWAQAVERWARTWGAYEQRGDPLPKKVAVRLKTARLKRAGQLVRAEDFEGAESVLKQVIDCEPKDVSALTQFADVAMARGDWAQAVERWQAILDVHRNSISRTLGKLSTAYYNQGLLDEAVALLHGSQSCGLANDHSLLQLARFHSEKQEWKEAARLLNRVIPLDKESTIDLAFANFAAKVFWHAADIARAREILERATSGRDVKDIPIATRAMEKELDRHLRSPNRIDVVTVSKRYYDDIYEKYTEYEKNGQESVYAPVWHKIASRINNEGIQHVLDVGCGPGQFAEYITQQCPIINYTGIDFSSVAVEQARDRCPSAKFLEADVFTSDVFRRETFDAVILLEVLEHIEDDCLLLETIPVNKKVIASVPNFDSFGHVRFFDNKSEVERRYTDFFKRIQIETVSILKSSVIFLIAGEK